jgi:hypothetical protein
MTGSNFDPAAAVDALAALLATRCPWWCDHSEEGHQWMDDGPEGYWRAHARTVGPFTVVAAERLNPDGSTELGVAGVETHLDDFEESEEARRYAADLVEVARVLDAIALASVAGD